MRSASNRPIPFLFFLVIVACSFYKVILILTVKLSGSRHAFPLSIHEDTFESITLEFPENPEFSITLNLPKFWFPSKWDKKMTRRMASSVGSYAPSNEGIANYMFRSLKSDSTSSWDFRTIFVGISTYKSLHCQKTINHIFLRALHPDRIRVGIVDQTDTESSCDSPAVPCEEEPNQVLCKFHGQIDIYPLHPAKDFVVGSILIHHVVERMYRGEYYVLLTNVNNVMVSGWDADAIRQFESLQNEMAILSTIPTAANEKNFNMTSWSAQRDTRVVLCNAEFFGESYATKLLTIVNEDQPELVSPSMPQLCPYWSSDFSFSRGHFVLNVPFDPYLSVPINGEDLTMSIRAFTHGYDIYTPEKPLCFYLESKFNLNRYLQKNAEKYPSLSKTIEDRLFGIVRLLPSKSSSSRSYTEKERYGLGSERDPAKFFATFGIHVQEKITERNLCNFVSTGGMHILFQEHMKPDSMGIDYKDIHFRFHELLNIHELYN